MRIEDYKITITHIDTGRSIVTDEVGLSVAAFQCFHPTIEVTDFEFDFLTNNEVYVSGCEAFVEDEAQLMEDTITDACNKLFRQQKEDKS